MTARALLIVPPFIKYNAGPLLGPALLQSAARQKGHVCSLLDLNALWIQRQKSFIRIPRSAKEPNFAGVHNKCHHLNNVEELWTRHIVGSLSDVDSSRMVNIQEKKRRFHFGFLSQEEIRGAAVQLARSDFGAWARNRMLDVYLEGGESPIQVIGLSLLHAGQVVPATALSMLAKEMWPQALIVWGGPHITGLGKNALHDDIQTRTSYAADIFVQGHAEETFVKLLDNVNALDSSKSQLMSSIIKGTRGTFMHQPLMPSFDNLDVYGKPFTLPAQTSLGCAYGKCAFCTYPSMEGTPAPLSIQATLEPIVEFAEIQGVDRCSAISLKDSLVTPKRLREIAAFVQGRVRWSACTKLSKRLCDLETMLQLEKGGLATLEVGLESLLPETQRRVGKIQSKTLFENFVNTASQTRNTTLVVNYMTGFPWEDPLESEAYLRRTKEVVDLSLGARGKVEHNVFELERLSPMAQNPEKYGIDVHRLKLWPWASVVEQI